MGSAVLVRDDIDRKILILYVLRNLPSPVDSELLYEICFCDDGLGYFDYSNCLSELVNSGNIEEIDEEYKITDKGANNADTLMTSLPFSVRNAADKRISPAVEMLERYSLIQADYEKREEGTYIHLALSDGELQLADLRLFCGEEKTAKQIKKNFRRQAENCYQGILALLADCGKDKL